MRTTEDPKAFEKTLNLPKSSFPMKANSIAREPELLEACTSHLYEKQDKDAPTFVLHDGPPYANGAVHLGHAMNKVLKDMVNRVNLGQGKRVHYIPGWDCHGLPIELKAVENLPKGAPLTPENVTAVATQCAQSELKGQMASFRSWGVMGDWNKRYETMDPEYEKSQLRAFKKMVLNKKIHRGIKPVWWSPWTQTALAEAELVYEEQHKSLSVWVDFPLVETRCDAVKALLDKGCRVSCVAWTTTPWTLPSNRALVLHEQLRYSAVHTQADASTVYVVATDLLESFQKRLDKGALVECASFTGLDLLGSVAQHPVVQGRTSVVLNADFVTTTDGTGVVHAAPGHGQDDYLVCGQAGIEPFSPVDHMGCYTEEVGVPELVGLDVLDKGSRAVVKMLEQSGRLLAKKFHVHKYPYDWRSKKPVIVRSTFQWFLESQSLKPVAAQALENVRFFPESGKHKMMKTVSNRMEDWCISRQRFWGVPIPAFYHKETGEVLMNEHTVDSFLKQMEHVKQGVGCWWSSAVSDLLPESHKQDAEKWEKGTDTMDVWMDSGLSWAHMQDRGVSCPVDVVLEGTDQYRGWFQSLLLTWLAAGNVGAPFKAVVVHGFCLDSNGVKMSKSVGNVVPPSAVTHGSGPLKGEPRGFEANGVDVMRMWVASHDYSKDVAVSRVAFDAVAMHYRKVRNTMRWIMGVLEDFDPSVSVTRNGYLAAHLKWMTQNAEEAVLKHFDELNFAGVVQKVAEFISGFSSLHVEAMKDSLYCNGRNDPTGLRQCNQQALYGALKFLVLSLDPIMPHTMADARQHMPEKWRFGYQWSPRSAKLDAPEGWSTLSKLRDAVQRLLEEARNARFIGSPLGAHIRLLVPENSSVLKPLAWLGDQEQACFFGAVSQFSVTHEQLVSKFMDDVEVDGEKFMLSVDTVGLHECPRCWMKSEVMQHLCSRCDAVLKVQK